MKKQLLFLALSFLLATTSLFAQVNGTAIDPVESTDLNNPVYFYIESASDSSYVFSGYSGDFRGEVIISPDVENTKLIHNDLSTAPTPDHALWYLVKKNGVMLLKNKATGFYMKGSHTAGTDSVANVFKWTSLGEKQFTLRTGDASSYTVTWKNNLCDRLNVGLQMNSLSAWYFIVANPAQLQEILKLTLQNRLNEVNDILTNTKEGTDVGQYSADSRAELIAVQTDAQAVYDNNASTIDEITIATNYLNEAMATFKSNINVNLSALVSTDPGNYRWYNIRNYGTGVSYCFNKVISSRNRTSGQKYIYETKVDSLNDGQLFRFELSDDKSTILNIVDKSGFYLSANGTVTTEPSPDNTFSIQAQTDGIAFYLQPSTLAAPIRANESGTIDNWKYLAGGASSWVFDYVSESLIIDSEKAKLKSNIDTSKEILVKTLEGTEPGQFSAQSRSALITSQDMAQSVYDNAAASIDDCNLAVIALNDANKTYFASANIPVISTESNTKWYVIQGSRPANMWMTSTGELANIIGQAAIPDSTQLWKFVANSAGTANGFAIVNKATGQYLSANTENNLPLTTIDTLPSNNLRFIPNNIITNKIVGLWIENVVESTIPFRLHAGNAGVMNWTGNAYDNSSWVVVEYVTALKQALQATITSVQNLATASVTGTDFGQYTAENKATLQSAIDAAKAVFENPASTDAQLIEANSTLAFAAAVYKETININPISLLSTTPGAYRWYNIRSYATNTNAAYCFGKVMSKGSRIAGENYTFETKISPDTITQLFRFVLTADSTKVLNIFDGTGTQITFDGKIDSLATADNDFTLSVLGDGIGFWIKPTTVAPLHAQFANTHIVNWSNVEGSASSWVFDFVKEAYPTAVKQVEAPKYRIHVENGLVRVDGVTDFDIYSVTGQLQNKNRSLNKGIYLIKIDQHVSKILIK